jgi:hypothetical protein
MKIKKMLAGALLTLTVVAGTGGATSATGTVQSTAPTTGSRRLHRQ